MKIGIISDTHNNLKSVEKAVSLFNKYQVRYIFHSGDMVSPVTARAFAGAAGAKFIAVLGNCDSKHAGLRDAIEEFGGQLHERFYSGKVNGKRIYMSHKLTELEEVVNGGRCDLAIYGHTHKQDIRWAGDVLIVNPGSANDMSTPGGCVIILDIDDMSYEIVPLS